MKILKGVVASMGIAIGHAHVCAFIDPELIPQPIALAAVAAEKVRFHEACASLKEQYARAYERAKANEERGKEAAEILEAQSLLLSDPMLIEMVENKISNDHVDAAYAVDKSVQESIALFAGIADPLIAQRVMDLQDVARRLIRILLGGVSADVGSKLLSEGDLVVAENILPTDFLELDKAHMSAMVLDHGATTSHTAILAQAFGIPTVVGLGGQTALISQDDLLIVDANKGEVILNPDEETLAAYQEKLKLWQDEKEQLAAIKDLRAITTDGHQIRLKVNMEILEEATMAQQVGAQGVGLFRSEFPFMQQGRLLDEGEQFAIYKQLMSSMADSGIVTIRTIDVGGDKLLSKLSIMDEENPALGYRAIRYCMDNQPFFRTQLRAILRASAFGKARMMFPMVSGVDELEEVLAVLDSVKAELRSEEIPFDEHIGIGTMIEVPSAVLQARGLAKRSDFVSIGTNDLIQYLLAVDRNNERLSSLYEPYHPAVLSAIAQVVDAAHKEHIPVSVCGEMAADPISALILVGLGVDELSMNAYALPQVKAQIRATSYKKLCKTMAKVKNLDRISDIRDHIERSLGIVLKIGNET